ncbi:MAG: PASTA domain-containing protein [Bacteroidales bacterium]|nr:PASTA domain-containing protein [Bacteroidales bacterium]
MATNFLKKIVKSKVLRHIVFAAIVALVVVVAVSFYLKSYTNHGQKIFTPSFKGLTVAEAQKLAQDKKIKIEVIDSVYEAYGEPGTVIDQTPKSNFMIKEGRNIFLTIKANGQKMVSMPNLRSVSLIQARSEIESNYLKIGKIDYQPSQFNDLVIEQLLNDEIIAPGTSLPAGTKIDLIVGKKQGSEAVVPKLIGLTADQASFKAAEYSLNIGQVNYDESVVSEQDKAEAVIWKQSLGVDRMVAYGEEIDIWLTIDPEKY